jgi:hypothetical protein
MRLSSQFDGWVISKHLKSRTTQLLNIRKGYKMVMILHKYHTATTTKVTSEFCFFT